LLTSGHRACAGCGEALGAKLVMDAAGPNTYVATSTGCLEVFSTPYPESAWRIPWVHSLFENSAAVACGIDAALRAKGKREGVNIIAQGGDGGTADIGIGCLSGMLERNQQILYVCYDNEAYMNTGVQRSGLTPFNTHTSTSPAGKESFGNQFAKKPLLQIVAAHNIPFATSATIAYPADVQIKVKKALAEKGATFIHLHVPCPLGWAYKTEETVEIARLAVQTGLFPIVEMRYGEVTRVRKITKERRPVEDYLKLQGRYRHLFASSDGKKEVDKIQAIADANIAKFGLM
jgi:pyruvate ferredoxin oxidoreductase beta subunit